MSYLVPPEGIEELPEGIASSSAYGRLVAIQGVGFSPL